MALLLCEVLLGALAFLLGASVFSFLNVIVYRVPKKESFVAGRSYCPSCGHTLSMLDLVPVLSYLVLRGRCRYCGEKIGPRDTFVEVFGGGIAIFCGYWYLDEPMRGVLYFAFFSVLTVVTLMDWDTMEIEDGCEIAILILAVISLFVVPEITIVQRLIGAVCVSVPMLILTILIPGAFGGGDIKLMAAAGLFLGWKLTLVSTALGILFGGAYGIAVLVTKKLDRKDHFAFGPFLCMGMALGLLFGEQILDWYMGFMMI